MDVYSTNDQPYSNLVYVAEKHLQRGASKGGQVQYQRKIISE